MVTPFTDELMIDVAAYRDILEWHLTFDTGGIYANCLSSEMYELSEEERLLLISEAVKITRGRVPVAATGNFGETIDQQLDFCRKAADAGADIVMLTVPAGLQNDEEMERYFLTFAEETEMPLGLYECPFPRHYHLGLKLIRKLTESDRFVAYKETSCDLDKILAVQEITGDSNLALLQANVPFMLESVRAGVPGSMNVVANWLPDLTIEVMKRGLAQDPSAEELNALLCAMELAQRSVHPAGVKYLMSKRGLPIKPHTRISRRMTREEQRSLDIVSELWFRQDGSLSIW
jgi:4-hydroxy-tetrahydrodipicolinate synthase